MIFKVFYLKGISLRIYSMIRIDGVLKKRQKRFNVVCCEQDETLVIFSGYILLKDKTRLFYFLFL